MQIMPSRPITPLPEDVLAAAAVRGGYVSRARLQGLGHRPAAIEWWLQAGLLERASRGQYRLAQLGAPPDGGLGRLATALERAGDGARIGGAWACGLHRLEGFDLSGTDHVVIDPARRVRGAGFRVVRSRVGPPDDAEVCGLPCLTVPRALVRVAGTSAPKACGSRSTPRGGPGSSRWMR